jgi:hypothetical protein
MINVRAAENPCCISPESPPATLQLQLLAEQQSTVAVYVLHCIHRTPAALLALALIPVTSHVLTQALFHTQYQN